MFQMVFQRHELKYLLDDAQRHRLEALVSRHMQPDAYGPSTVCNLYYDTPSLLLGRRSIARPTYKEKIRVRSYGVSDGASPVFVELKKKFRGVTYKRRVSLLPAQAASLLAGQGPLDTQIEREIDFAARRYEDLAPRAFIGYDRNAFFSPEDSNFRMTFDESLRVRWDWLSLAAGDDGDPLLEEGLTVLEVKCLGGMPLWLVGFFSAEGLHKVGWSKYGTACKVRMGMVPAQG
ncbi:polyphosphate polymerase domain-containing protein [Thermophilibacter immobilis]|uniref:Polyphosphate polymerase domain-containing protein n=1 Tax=Thermophilibacter immobilis TaxID=2779519 RepID=A0A7S7M9I2_9ACTN|nr:polyphosphate polymerase domain-containing protein [Thermophilibacter immobilis]QOY61224.1 polyphosphate polymerase domain-containing protein [Thermophilibacter immobilis]